MKYDFDELINKLIDIEIEKTFDEDYLPKFENVSDIREAIIPLTDDLSDEEFEEIEKQILSLSEKDIETINDMIFDEFYADSGKIHWSKL